MPEVIPHECCDEAKQMIWHDAVYKCYRYDAGYEGHKINYCPFCGQSLSQTKESKLLDYEALLKLAKEEAELEAAIQYPTLSQQTNVLVDKRKELTERLTEKYYEQYTKDTG